MTTMAEPTRLDPVPDVLSQCCIARDPDDPRKSAVWYIPPRGGRTRLVAGGFESRQRANAWIEFHMTGHKDKSPAPAQG